jgi:septum site-determining protein MinD
MIVAVAGGKGGVGKSTVALNLGAALDAVVVDADLAMADLPGGRGPDLHDVLAGRADPLEAVRGGGSVALVPCGRTLAGARAADTRALSETLAAVAAEYGRVVVDTPAGLAADAGLALQAADCSVLVSTPAAAAVAGALRTRELARELDAGVAAVALNRYGETVPRTAVREALGAPVVAIPESEAVAAARESGRPVAAERTAGQRFRELARTVAGVAQSGRS